MPVFTVIFAFYISIRFKSVNLSHNITRIIKYSAFNNSANFYLKYHLILHFIQKSIAVKIIVLFRLLKIDIIKLLIYK